MKNYTYGSGFAGIGGMTMGLKDLGFEGVIAWEFDPSTKRQYAAEAHKLLHPEIELSGNICEVDTALVPYMDLFCFTPPCQAFSVAGTRGGFEDTRGTLTFEALRIAKDKKPKILFMENVKGLVNHDKGNTLSTILHAVNEIGYLVDFTVLNSKYFDVAQNRERLYMVAVREDLIEKEEWTGTKGTTMLPKARKRYSEEGLRTFNFNWPQQLEVRTKLKDFLESEVDAKYYMHEDKTSELIKQLENGVPVKMEKLDSPKMLGMLNMLGNDQIRRVYSDEGMSPTLTTMQGGHQEPKIAEEVRAIITPDRLVKRQDGRRFKEDGEESFTVTTIDRHGVAIGNYPKYAIRKLTPRECLRLQSVDEKYIDIILENFSDSKAYKFAGNGLTTNVIKAIGKEIRNLLEVL